MGRHSASPIDLIKQSAPATPDSGYGRLFVDTSGHLKFIDDAGTITDIINSGTVVSSNVGNGSSTTIDVAHNLGTRDIVVAVRKVASPYGMMLVPWEALDTNTVRLYFTTAPASGEFRVTVMAAGSFKNGLNAVAAETHADAGSASSNSEQTLASLAIPTTVASGDEIAFSLFGDLLNNSGSNVTYTWKFKIGATTVFTTDAISVPTAASRRDWQAIFLIRPSTTATERIHGHLTIGTNTTPVFTAGPSFTRHGYGTASEDLTAGVNAILTCQMGTNVSTADVIMHSAQLQVIKK